MEVSIEYIVYNAKYADEYCTYCMGTFDLGFPFSLIMKPNAFVINPLTLFSPMLL